jgi:G protein beta subunit-like protein
MSVVLATGVFDHKIRLLDAPSGETIRAISFPDSQINRLSITPDKQFIAAAGNPVIRLYEIMSSSSSGPVNANNNNSQHATDVNSSQQQQAVLTLEGHTSNVTSIGFQKDGRFLYSGSEDGTVKIWDLRNQNYSRSFECGAAVNSVTLRADRDELISADSNGCVKIWDLGGSGCLATLQPGLHWNTNGSESEIAGTKGDPTHSQAPAAATTSTSTNQHKHSRRGNYYESTVTMQVVDISDDCRTLVAITNHGVVYVWDSNVSQTNASHVRPVTKFRAHAPGYYCLHGKIAPDCRHLVTCGSDGLAKLWDTTTWELTETLENTKWVYDAAFCADSSYLVTASSDHIARLWNLKTADVVRRYHGHQGTVTCVALNDSSV